MLSIPGSSGGLIVAHEYVSPLPFLVFPALHLHWKQYYDNFFINNNSMVSFHNVTPLYSKGAGTVDVSADGELAAIASPICTLMPLAWV